MLLRTPERLGPSPNNPTSPVYPLAANFANGVNLFHPDYQAPHARSADRPPARDQQADRDRGSLRWHRLVDGSTTENWNEINFTSNGFLDEFRRAAEPAVAHRRRVRSGRQPACSFAYRGRRTKLPIYLAAFNGLGASAAGDPRHAGANWTNAQRLAELAMRSPNPGGAASTLFTTAAFRTSMTTAGYPRNFFVLNPGRGSQRSNQRGFTHDSVQVLLRRALSSGLRR